MDKPHEDRPDDEADASPQVGEAAIRDMLEQSRRDIADGRTQPLTPVLDRLRDTAERMRRQPGAARIDRNLA